MLIDLSRNKKQLQYFLEVMAAVAGKSPSRFLGYGGAIRGGKTFGVLAVIITMCKKFPLSKWHIVRKDFPVLRSTTIESFKKIIGDSRAWREDRTPSNYHFEYLPTGARVFFKAESLYTDPDLKDFLGLETNGIFLEQAEELSNKMWERAKERIGSWYCDPMPPPFIFLTFNVAKNFVRGIFYEPFISGTLSPPFFYVPASPKDNPFVTEEQWKVWSQLDRISYLKMIGADWDADDTEGKFYHSFSYLEHVKEVNFDQFTPVHISFDQNVRPYITATLWHVIPGDAGTYTAGQFDEFTLSPPNNTTEDLCRAIINKYGDRLTSVFLYGDASGNKQDTRSKETDYTIAMRLFRKWVSRASDRTMRNNPRIFQRRAWIAKIMEGKELVKLEIDPRCRKSIEDLRSVEIDVNGDKLKKIEKVDGVSAQIYGHTSDTMDYFLVAAFKKEYERYIRQKY